MANEIRVLFDMYQSAFYDRNFFFIVNQGGKEHGRQKEALEILCDNVTEEFGYGGAAGGAKSWTGCCWLVFMCKIYAGTRWFIGREELKRLRESTLMTFYKVCKEYDVTGWKYNGQDHYILFENGSRVDLLDLKYLPSDPLYERYGSIEYTGGWIEEGGEVNFGAYDTLKSRVGRHMNRDYKILGKIFVTLNPKKNWCHSTFWKPYKSNTLPPNVKFLQSLVTDNPFIDPNYIDKLHSIKDKVRKQRLLFGNFDYDDDDDALMDYDAITDLYSNEFVPEGEKYITADVARFGADKGKIGLWSGFRCEKRWTLEHKKVTETAAFIEALRVKEGVPLSSVIVDDDGVGGGVTDILGCNGFVNNSSPLPNPETQEDENYKNLQSQCAYMFASKVNAREMYVRCDDQEERDEITEDVEMTKRKEVDTDKKLAILPKEDVKKLLGRSPDNRDMLLMRMWFELSPKRNFYAF
ncbi:MAG: phage portal protein [Agriterribacter sp.]